MNDLKSRSDRPVRPIHSSPVADSQHRRSASRTWPRGQWVQVTTVQDRSPRSNLRSARSCGAVFLKGEPIVVRRRKGNAWAPARAGRRRARRSCRRAGPSVMPDGAMPMTIGPAGPGFDSVSSVPQPDWRARSTAAKVGAARVVAPVVVVSAARPGSSPSWSSRPTRPGPSSRWSATRSARSLRNAIPVHRAGAGRLTRGTRPSGRLLHRRPGRARDRARGRRPSGGPCDPSAGLAGDAMVSPAGPSRPNAPVSAAVGVDEPAEAVRVRVDVDRSGAERPR